MKIPFRGGDDDPSDKDLKKLQKDLEAIDKNQEDLISIMRSLQKRLTGLAVEEKVDRSSLEQQMERLEENLASINEFSDLSEHIEELEEQSDRIQHTLDADVFGLEDRIETLHDALGDLLEDVEEVDEEKSQQIEGLRDSLNDLQAAVQEARSAEEEDTTHLEERLSAVQDRMEEMDWIEEQLETKLDQDQFREHIEGLQERLASTSDLNQIRERLQTISSKTARISETEQQLERLAAQEDEDVEHLTRKIQELREQLEAHGSRDGGGGASAAIQSELEELRERMQEIESEHVDEEELQREIDDLTAVIENLAQRQSGGSSGVSRAEFEELREDVQDLSTLMLEVLEEEFR